MLSLLSNSKPSKVLEIKIDQFISIFKNDTVSDNVIQIINEEIQKIGRVNIYDKPVEFVNTVNNLVK